MNEDMLQLMIMPFIITMTANQVNVPANQPE